MNLVSQPSPSNERQESSPRESSEPRGWRALVALEDWWAVWIGGLILTVAFLTVWFGRPADWANRLKSVRDQQKRVDQLLAHPDRATASADELERARQRLISLQSALGVNPARGWVAKLQPWSVSPGEAFFEMKNHRRTFRLHAILIVGLVSGLLFAIGEASMGRPAAKFLPAFAVVFALAVLAFLLASHRVIRQYNLEYPLWALLVGLVVANTVGTPQRLRPAVRTEFYIKTGLVLLGAKILLGRLFALGVPGMGVSWVVTPIVLVTTYWFGQRVLQMGSKSLNMTISADMSVCGVSAAIATAAACRAKKEELSVAIGLSLTFTVVMMLAMPLVIRSLGISDVLGGAWLGGTVDATGAVAAAGAFLGSTAESVAITVKMIQNILIGVIAFGVAVYWVTFVEPSDTNQRPSPWEIWHRFPKFVLGFVTASVVFSVLATHIAGGSFLVDSMIRGTTDVLRGWFFCLAFVCIGLETDFRSLAEHFRGGKPLILYVAGQSLNLLLTLFMAWLMFEVVFASAARNL